MKAWINNNNKRISDGQHWTKTINSSSTAWTLVHRKVVRESSAVYFYTTGWSPYMLLPGLTLSLLSKYIFQLPRMETAKDKFLPTARQGYKSSTKKRHPHTRWLECKGRLRCLSGMVGKFGLGKTSDKDLIFLEFAQRNQLSQRLMSPISP